MPAEKNSASPMLTITKHIPLIEKVLLTALSVGLVLTVMKINVTVTAMTMILLGVTFFLFAYRPADLPDPENEKFGFSELLALMIVPKVLWISSAVSAMGIAFYFMDLGNDGYKQMLMIGALSIGAGCVLFAFFLMSGVKYLNTVSPVLLRAVPLLLADVYILFN